MQSLVDPPVEQQGRNCGGLLGPGGLIGPTGGAEQMDTSPLSPPKGIRKGVSRQIRGRFPARRRPLLITAGSVRFHATLGFDAICLHRCQFHHRLVGFSRNRIRIQAAAFMSPLGSAACETGRPNNSRCIPRLPWWSRLWCSFQEADSNVIFEPDVSHSGWDRQGHHVSPGQRHTVGTDINQMRRIPLISLEWKIKAQTIKRCLF